MPPSCSTRVSSLLLVLVGCSGDGDGATASASAPTTVPASAASATDSGTTTATATTGSLSEVPTGDTTVDATVTVGSTTSPETASGGTEATSVATDGSTTSGPGSDATDGASTDGSSTGGTSTGGDVMPFFPPCDEIVIGEPILLEDLEQDSSWRSPATLAWDGQDLVVVRDDRNEQGNACETLFERRGPDGQLLAPGVRSPSAGVCGMNGSLGYNPVSDVFLFTNQIQGPRVGVVGLSAAGAVLWKGAEWDVCNSLTTTIDVAPRGDGFMVMGEQYSCAGDGPRHTSASYYTPAGEREFFLQTGKATGSTGDAACDAPACDRLLTLRYGNENDESGTFAQMGDLTAGMLEPAKVKLNGSAFGGWDASGAAFNGDDWLIVRIEDTGPSHQGHIGRWHETNGWTTDIAKFGSGGTPTELEILWTGNDYLIFYAEWPDDNMGLPDNFFDLSIWYLLVGADGVIKQNESFERPLGFGGYAPQLVGLPGAIALSWVRVTEVGPNNNTYSRHLSRIECAM